MSKEARIQVLEGLGRVLPVVVIIVLFIWFSGQHTGLGGKQEAVQWSAEAMTGRIFHSSENTG